MKKIILTLIISLLIPAKALALAPTNITATQKETKQLKVQNQDFPFPPEITPLTLMQSNGQRLYVLSTQWSFLCTSADNILNSSPSSPLHLSSQNCQLVTKPDVYNSYDPNNTGSSVKMRFKDPSVINPITQMTKDWKRTYDGLLSLHLVNNQLIGVRHNEHVNHEYPADWTGEGKAFIYQNTMQNGVPASIAAGGTPYIDAVFKYSWPTGCRSGYAIPRFNASGDNLAQSGGYDQCWDSFSNFVSLLQIDTNSGNWTPNPAIKNPETDIKVHDQGPIIWPDSNYRGGYDGLGNIISPANHWRTSGFYQPTSFVNNDYIYTFFKTGKWGGYCTGAARAPLNSNGSAGSWKFFNRARNGFDVPSLPSGFTKETIRNYYDAITGNKSDCIVDESDTSQPQYFNVAKIKGTQYFIATEERSYVSTGKWAMGVRFSTDLTNWSSLQELSSCQAETGGSSVGWGCGLFAYPTLLDKNATTNYEVDKDELYILGTHAGSGGYELNAMKLSLSLPVNIFDLRYFLTKFLNPLTIFDYNKLVENFGK